MSVSYVLHDRPNAQSEFSLYKNDGVAACHAYCF